MSTPEFVNSRELQAILLGIPVDFACGSQWKLQSKCAVQRGVNSSRNQPEQVVLQKLREMMEVFGNASRRKRLEEQDLPQQCEADHGPGQLIPKGQLNSRHCEVEAPVFNTYEDFHKMVLQSLQTISIVLDIHGIIVFVSENILGLLGYDSAEMVGQTLLSILPDDEQDAVAQKIILSLPLVHLVGQRIEFCCYLKRGDFNQDDCCAYEYVKFIMNLQNAYDESFVFFGSVDPNHKSIQSSRTKLLWEQQYYLVGNICVLSKQRMRAATEVDEVVVIDDSDEEDNTLGYKSPEKRCCLGDEHEEPSTYEDMCEIRSDSSSDVEIIDDVSSDLKEPTEVIKINSDETSMSSIDFTTPSKISSEISSKRLEPLMDIECPMDSECLQDELTKAYIPQAEVEDRDEVQQEPKNTESAAVEYYMTTPNSEDQEKEQVHTQHLSPLVEPMCLEAMVEPLVHFVTQPITLCHVHSERPLLGERFGKLYSSQRKTRVLDLSISRTFCDASPNLKHEEEEEERYIQVLSQNIEFLQDPKNQQQMPAEEPYKKEQLRQQSYPLSDNPPLLILDYQNEEPECSQNGIYSLQENLMDQSPPHSEPTSLFGSPHPSEDANGLQLPALELHDNFRQLWENATTLIAEQHNLIKTDTWLCSERDSMEDEPFGDEVSPIYRPEKTSHFMSTIPLDFEELQEQEDIHSQP